MNNDKYYTELDKNLQQLAIMDWPAFVELVGYDNIKAAKICILKSRGKSYSQIANKLRITKDTAIYRSGKCDCK
jgi:hypothetical protein